MATMRELEMRLSAVRTRAEDARERHDKLVAEAKAKYGVGTVEELEKLESDLAKEADNLETELTREMESADKELRSIEQTLGIR